MTSLFFFCSLCLCMIFFSSCQGRVKLPENVTIPAVFMFGDSIVDTGNNNNLPTLGKCNFPPYGRDFMGGLPTGRFGNGKVPSDILVEQLGIKELLPAYLDPYLQDKDLPTGVNFASGGVGFDPLTSKIVSVISLTEQLQLLKEYTERLRNYVGDARASEIISSSLFMVVAGSNDIANTYFHTPVRFPQYNISAYTDFMLTHASAFVQKLHAMGARRIGVGNIPPVGCVPAQRTLGGGFQRKCVEEVNEAVQMFNTKLSAEADRLTTHVFHFQTRVIIMDVYSPFVDIIRNSQKYGFEVINRGCCGTGLIEVVFLCNRWSPGTCQNLSTYVFWDGYHPTERAYKIMLNQTLQNFIDALFDRQQLIR